MQRTNGNHLSTVWFHRWSATKMNRHIVDWNVLTKMHLKSFIVNFMHFLTRKIENFFIFILFLFEIIWWRGVDCFQIYWFHSFFFALKRKRKYRWKMVRWVYISIFFITNRKYDCFCFILLDELQSKAK